MKPIESGNINSDTLYSSRIITNDYKSIAFKNDLFRDS